MTNPNPAPCDHVVFTDFDGVEGILVDLNTKKYYQLNETAMMIWKGLEKGRSSIEIAAEIAESYDITPEDALQNVEKAVKEFETNRLIGK